MALLLGELSRVKRETEEAALNWPNGESKATKADLAKGMAAGGSGIVILGWTSASSLVSTIALVLYELSLASRPINVNSSCNRSSSHFTPRASLSRSDVRLLKARRIMGLFRYSR